MSNSDSEDYTEQEQEYPSNTSAPRVVELLISAETVFHYNTLAATLLDYAVNGAKGRDELDDVYQSIVEHRDGPTARQRAHYSSCGDLAHWLYARLGCLEAPFMNRDEEPGEGGEADWRSGVNLNRWVGRPIGPNPYARKPTAATCDLHSPYAFGTGDVVVVMNSFGGHVMCVTAWEPATVGTPRRLPTLYTAEYGQPGGKAKQHQVSAGNSPRGSVYVGSNPIIAHARMHEVLAGEADAGRLQVPDWECLRGWQAAEALQQWERVWA